MTDTGELQPGTVLGGCRVEKLIGRGGMGEVYLAEHLVLQKRVAIKTARASLQSRERDRERFLKEARLAAKVDHPNVITIHDAGDLNGTLYIVMQFVEGQDLAQVLKATPTPLAWPLVLAWMRDAAKGLVAVHKRGLIHRDIKPHNIMLTDDHRIIVMDFGLVREEDPDVSVTSGVVGSPAYMSPEQCRSERLDHRTDIYSLGTTAYNLLSGKPPFLEKSVHLVIMKLANNAVAERLDHVRQDIPAQVADLIARTMAPHLEDRVADASTLVRELEHLLSGVPVPSLTLERETSRLGATVVPSGTEPPPTGTPPQNTENTGLATSTRVETVRPGLPNQPPATSHVAIERARRRWLPKVLTGAAIAAATVGGFVWGPKLLSRGAAERPELHTGIPNTAPAAVKKPTPAMDTTLSKASHVVRPTVKSAANSGVSTQKRKPLNSRTEQKSLGKERVARPVAEPQVPVQAPDLPVDSGKISPDLLHAPFTVQEALAARNAWSKYLGVEERLEISGSVSLVLIPPGEFQMGTTSAQVRTMQAFDPGFDARLTTEEMPAHLAEIAEPFFLATCELTKGEFARFVESQGYRTESERDGAGGFGIDVNGHYVQKLEYSWRNPGFPQAENHPVVNVSWNDAVAYCNWRSRTEGKVPAYVIEGGTVRQTMASGYRLPTEAEWEFACRAGSLSSFSCGDDPEGLATVANIADRTLKAKLSGVTTLAASDGHVFTAPVGSFRQNAFGLHDMHGNVWEWCGDFFYPYPVNRASVSQKASAKATRIYRGGYWYSPAGLCRSAFRGWRSGSDRRYGLGFRMALSPAGPMSK